PELGTAIRTQEGDHPLHLFPSEASGDYPAPARTRQANPSIMPWRDGHSSVESGGSATVVPGAEEAPMSKTYRVAVIGRTGKGNYGHGLDVVWKDIPGAVVVAVADPDEKGRAAAAKKLGVKNAYADYRAMLEKEKPQIVSVADRHVDLHRDVVVACARAGASVFLEKPMARTLEEADEMVKACQTHHVKLAIAHQTRHSPRVARARELITSGRLGDLLELRGRGKEDARGGGQDLM